MSNPYVQKFAKAFTTGLFAVVFVALVVLAMCIPKDAFAGSEGSLPVVCIPAQQFQKEYQNGDFEILSSTFVVIFPKGEATKIRRVITKGVADGGDSIVGTWLIDNQSNFCLIMMESVGKQIKM